MILVYNDLTVVISMPELIHHDWSDFDVLDAVATPKQIRELMQVDGLTNDEVKSHLQVLSKSYMFLLVAS